MNFDIVFIPMHDWRKGLRESFRTRDGHWMRQLARRDDVRRLLVVNRPVSPLERLRDIRKPDPMRSQPAAAIELESCGARLHVAPPSLTGVSRETHILDIRSSDLFGPLKYRRDWWRNALIHRSTIRAVKEAMASLGMEPGRPDRRLVLWIEQPFGAELMDLIPADLTVFDGLDDWLEHPDFGDPFGYIARGYEIVRKRADVIFANSQGLADKLNVGRPMGMRPAEFLGNGVDIETVRREAGSPEPAALKPIDRPRIGFFGKFSSKVDFALMRELARLAPPEWSFVLAGQALRPTELKELLATGRFTWIGDLPYEALGDHLAHVDVGIIPYRPEASKNMDPLKFYEYLAAGLPVVSTPITGVRPEWPGVWVAPDAAEFVNAIQNALRLDPETRATLHRAIPAELAWPRRLDAIMRTIEESPVKGK